jgi:hypothetical protein
MTTINYFNLHNERSNHFFYGYFKISIFPILLLNISIIISTLTGDSENTTYILKTIVAIDTLNLTTLHYTILYPWLSWILIHAIRHKLYLNNPKFNSKQEARLVITLLDKNIFTNELIQIVRSRDIPKNFTN